MTWVIGVDESGTGAWAGSFFLAAVVVPAWWDLHGVRDSKKTSPAQREVLVERMEQLLLLHVEVGVSPADIERYGHSNGYTRAFREVLLEALRYVPRGAVEVVVDGKSSQPLRTVLRELKVRAKFIAKADNMIPAVSAASIFAKFQRDAEMNLLDKLHPEYNFGKNAGYGSPEHIAAIERYGILRGVHRPLVRKLRRFHGSEEGSEEGRREGGEEKRKRRR